MRTFNFTFSEQEIAALQQALGDQPFKIAYPVLQSIEKQVVAQVKEEQSEEAEKAAFKEDKKK